MQPATETFDQWAAVDVMGHQRFYGRVTEQVIAGTGFVRVDVPASDERPAFSKVLGASAIYSISPMDESIVRKLAAEARETPIESYRLPALTPPAGPASEDQDCF